MTLLIVNIVIVCAVTVLLPTLQVGCRSIFQNIVNFSVHCVHVLCIIYQIIILYRIAILRVYQ